MAPIHLETRMGSSSLEYPTSSDVRRFALFSRDLVDVPSEDLYFSETRSMRRTGSTGRPLKKPRVHITPGAPPGTVAFLDWHPMDSDAIYIDFMKVRRDLRGEGLGKRLVLDFYESVVQPSGARYVDWGRVVSEAAWKVYEEARRRYPDIHHHGKVYF